MVFVAVLRMCQGSFRALWIVTVWKWRHHFKRQDKNKNIRVFIIYLFTANRASHRSHANGRFLSSASPLTACLRFLTGTTPGVSACDAGTFRGGGTTVSSGPSSSIIFFRKDESILCVSRRWDATLLQWGKITHDNNRIHICVMRSAVSYALLLTWKLAWKLILMACKPPFNVQSGYLCIIRGKYGATGKIIQGFAFAVLLWLILQSKREAA